MAGGTAACRWRLQCSSCRLQPFNVSASYGLEIAADPVLRPVPPGKLQQTLHRVLVKSHVHHPGRVAGHHGIWRNIVLDHRFRRHDGPVGNLDARQDNRHPADPNVNAYDGVATVFGLPGLDVEAFFPAMAEYVEWIGGEPRHGVVRAVHDEPRSLSNGAEATDYELVAHERIMVEHAPLHEFLRSFRIVVI